MPSLKEDVVGLFYRDAYRMIFLAAQVLSFFNLVKKILYRFLTPMLKAPCQEEIRIIIEWAKLNKSGPCLINQDQT